MLSDINDSATFILIQRAILMQFHIGYITGKNTPTQ